MADRPTSDPQWATVPTEPLSPPSSGLRTGGYVAGAVLPSSEFNSILQVLGEHAEWNLEGVRQPAQMTGAPSVTVNAVAKTLTRAAGSWLDDGFHDGMLITVSGFPTAGNNVTQVIDGEPTDSVLTLTSSVGLVNETDATVGVVSHFYVRQHLTVSQPSEFQQSLVVGSSLEVGGQVTLNDQLEVLGTSVFNDDVDIDGGLDVTGLITGNIESNSVDALQLYHGDQTLMLNPAGAWHGPNTTPSTDGYTTSSGAGSVIVTVPLRVGDQIKTAASRVFGNSSCQIDVFIRLHDGSGGSTDLGQFTTTPGAAWVSTTGTVTDHTLVIQESISVEIRFSANGGRCSAIAIGFNRPSP